MESSANSTFATYAALRRMLQNRNELTVAPNQFTEDSSNGPSVKCLNEDNIITSQEDKCQLNCRKRTEKSKIRLLNDQGCKYCLFLVLLLQLEQENMEQQYSASIDDSKFPFCRVMPEFITQNNFVSNFW